MKSEGAKYSVLDRAEPLAYPCAYSIGGGLVIRIRPLGSSGTQGVSSSYVLNILFSPVI